ncbi:hypothetical protein KIF59_05520 [Enterobacter cloacae subsp. cloacae]|nr:hypothetical protein [Enterobacter cloacae subsp. cloacae]
MGIVMQMSGFVSGQKTQPAEVSHTILLILSVGTLLVLFCGFLVSALQAQSTNPQHAARRDRENARESGRAMPEAVSPHARATVEMLAGMPFESLWGITTLLSQSQ